MSLVCAISGSLPEEPVLSKTGYIFERRLIEKHIDANGKCPVTGVELDKVDLHPINVPKTVKPRPITASSIPGLLSLFQSEWDSVMMETFQLRTQLETVRNQLSHSLYQHDAATRVIARLLKERDAANQQINDLQKQLATAKASEGGEEEIGISEALMNEMLELAQKLLGSRRKRQIQALTTVEQIKSYKASANYALHSTVSPGVLCLNIDPKTGNHMVTGGMDSMICYFDLAKQKTLCKLQGHMKRVNCVKIHPKETIVLSGSDDKTVRIWKGDEETFQYRCAHILRKHRGEVKSLAIHPLSGYFVSCGKDKSWIFADMNSGKCLQSYKELSCNYRCMSFHPDGLILGGGGDDGNVHIWDMKGSVFRVSLQGHTEAVTGLSFSENGYYLATASEDGSVRLWDLRKAICFQTIPLKDKEPVHAITFDYSGQYIAAASSHVEIYNFETRTAVASTVSLQEHTAAVTDVCFGPNVSFLMSSSLDRTVRRWEPSI